MIEITWHKDAKANTYYATHNGKRIATARKEATGSAWIGTVVGLGFPFGGRRLMDVKELAQRHVERIYGGGEWTLFPARDLKPGMILGRDTWKDGDREVVSVDVDTEAQTVSVELTSEGARELGFTWTTHAPLTPWSGSRCSFRDRGDSRQCRRPSGRANSRDRAVRCTPTRQRATRMHPDGRAQRCAQRPGSRGVERCSRHRPDGTEHRQDRGPGDRVRSASPRLGASWTGRPTPSLHPPYRAHAASPRRLR